MFYITHKMPWYDSDIFDGELTKLICERGIIEEGDFDESNDYPINEELIEWEKNG